MELVHGFHQARTPLVGAALVLLTAADALSAPPPKDLKVCISMNAGEGLTHDVPVAYCASDRGIKAAVGRNRSITVALKHNQTRRFVLTLGSRVVDDVGDPDPNNDGGLVGQPVPGDWSDYPIPTPPTDGVLPTFQVAYQVNVLQMGEPGKPPNPNDRNARLVFEDASGEDWVLLWGPHPQPGGLVRTNPAAPPVEILRRDDGSDLINEWDVQTLGDLLPARFGAATAFLYRVNGASPQDDDYWGAFDVSFSYCAIEEP